MVPSTYKMVDLGGIDLAEVNGRVVSGIYNKVSSAMNSCRIAIFCNWKFADIVIAPAHVLISVDETGGFLVNDLISVSQDDTVKLIGVVPEPVLQELSATANGEYVPPEGVDGFSLVNVNVPDIPPVVEELSVTENGVYVPEAGVDGFSRVSVDVPAPTVVNPYIVPFYEGFSYVYPGRDGNAWHDRSPGTYDGFFEITQGNYVIFEGEPVSNRFRVLFFAGKTKSDFEPYIETPASSTTQLYTATTNITGTDELAGSDLLKRIYFSVSSPGVIIFCTSNTGSTTKPFLFKITT